MSSDEGTEDMNPEEGTQDVSPEEISEAASTEESTEGWTPEQAIAEWRALTDQREAAQARFEEQTASFREALEAETGPLNAKLDDIEAWFLDHAEAAGTDAFAAEGGKVTISARENPKISDADSFFAWAESTNNSSLLQKRISVTEFRAFQKDNPDEVPPGVTVEISRSAKFKPAD